MISKKAGQRPVPRQSPAVAELELLPNENCSLNHFSERLTPCLARGIHLLSNFSDPLRVVFSFSLLFIQVFGAQRNIHGTESYAQVKLTT